MKNINENYYKSKTARFIEEKFYKKQRCTCVEINCPRNDGKVDVAYWINPGTSKADLLTTTLNILETYKLFGLNWNIE